jgi:acyl phosphate:glycerol-3-phosphate acyltransferase
MIAADAMWAAARWPLAAFLLGSIPFGYLVCRLALGTDVRQAGSGNIGATNVLRTGGKKLGLATLLLDAGKGWLAVWLALRFGGGWQAPGVLAAVLLAAVAGHLFSPWMGFRGGKGVATGLGAFLALTPGPLAAAVAIFLVVLALWRYVSLASIAACAALPLLLLAPLGQPRVPAALEAAAAATAALIVWRHRANIGRLRQGTEHKWGAKAAARA